MSNVKIGAVIYAPKVTVIWGIIADFFKEEGFPVEPVFYKDYVSQIDGLMNGEIDIAWNSPLAWVDAYIRTKGKALDGSMRDTDRDRQTYLVVRKDSGIESIEDLKGKKVAFVDPSSASGYVYPGAMLKDAGIDLNKDIKYQFSGGHDKSIQLLLNKDVDAIASYENVIKKYTKEFPTLKEDVRGLAKSELIPGVTVVVSNNVDDQLKSKIKQVLLEIQKEKETLGILTNLFNITGFEEPDDNTYKAVEKISEKMNIDLKKVK